MGRDAIYIPVIYRKIIIWLGFRSQVFLDITTQEDEIDKYQNIDAKKRIFQTETLISNILQICHRWSIKSKKLGQEFHIALKVGLGGSMKTSYTSMPETYTKPYQMRILSLSMTLMLSVSWQISHAKHKKLKILQKYLLILHKQQCRCMAYEYSWVVSKPLVVMSII